MVRLTWSRNGSLLNRFLTKPVFEALKHRVTKDYKASLHDVIRAAVEHLDSSVSSGTIPTTSGGGDGVFAPDPDAYRTFKPLLHPIICTLHDVNPDTRQPQAPPARDWLDNLLGIELDAKKAFIELVAVKVARSVSGYPFQPKMTEDHYTRMEVSWLPIKFMIRIDTMISDHQVTMKAAFKKISSPQSKDEDLKNGLATDVPGVGAVIGGTYYALDKIPSSLERQLDREGLLFDSCYDPIKVSANMCSHWPKGEDNKHLVQRVLL